MKRITLLTLGLGGTLLAATPAFADDPAATGGAPVASQPNPAAMAPAPAVSAAWGDRIIDRPYTLGAGKLSVYGDLDIISISLTFLGASDSFSEQLLHGGVGYGISDQLTVGAEYTIDAHDDAGSFPDNDRYKGPLQVYGSFGLAATDKLKVALTGQLVINLTGTGSSSSGSTDSPPTNVGLAAEISASYKLAPDVALFTGNPFGPGPSGLSANGLLSSELSVGLNNNQQTTLNIPIGVSVQASPNVFLFAETVIAEIRLANKQDGEDTASFFGSDTASGGLGIPANVGVFVTAAKGLDVGANVTFPDLNHAGDFYFVGLSARYFTP